MAPLLAHPTKKMSRWFFLVPYKSMLLRQSFWLTRIIHFVKLGESCVII
jgi:hypothetical protein